MGISEFALHNVLRTYSRQERLGQAQKPKYRSTQPNSTSDQVSLSRGAQKAHWVGQLAAEMVDRRDPHLMGDERSARIRAAKEDLLKHHSGEIGDESISPEDFQRKLRSTYLA